VKALLTKKIQFDEEKSKIKCLRTQLDLVRRLIDFVKGLIARKIHFKSILTLIRKKNKVWGLNYNF
jgi:hypothetical protein